MGCLGSKSPEERRQKVRIKQERDEKARMLKQAKKYIKRHYVMKKKMEDIGSRLQKYWMEIEGIQNKTTYILSVSKFSTICPIGDREEVDEKIDTLRKLFEELNKHPYIHEITEVAVDRVKKIDSDIVIVIQKESPEGSLRDIINGRDEGGFKKNWSEKGAKRDYSEEFQPMAKTYATQILEGMLFLKRIGFPHLGNIHLGNIFLVKGDNDQADGVCKISGHENALFGFRTSIFQQVAGTSGYLDGMDVIMFGRIVYELATCQQLEEIFPSAEQIEAITDQQVKNLLKYIFERSETKISHSLEEILKKIDEAKWYKKKTSRDIMQGVDETTEEMKEILRKIRP